MGHIRRSGFGGAGLAGASGSRDLPFGFYDACAWSPRGRNSYS